MMDLSTLNHLGAGALGFVLGWILYFGNRGRSGELSASEIGSLAAVISGAGLVGFLAEFQPAEGEADAVFGAYGVGLFLGFIAYFALFLVSKQGNLEPVLEVLNRDAPAPQGRDRGRSLRSQPEIASRSTPSEFDELDSAMEEALVEVTMRLASPGLSEQERQALIRAESSLWQLRTNAAFLKLIDTTDGGKLAPLLQVVSEQTQQLRAQANEIRDHAGDLERLRAVIEKAGRLLGPLRTA